MTHGKCGPWCKYEQHVSGDIGFAVRQYWYNTGDAQWLREIGWPLVKGIASFYAARVEPAPPGSHEFGNSTYVYNMVMGERHCCRSAVSSIFETMDGSR